MKNTIKVSISVHKGYSAVVIIYNGKKVHSVVNKANPNHSTNRKYLELLKTSLVLAQSITRDTNYINDENWDYSELIIDIKCNTVIQWMRNKYSKGRDKELFSEVLTLADNITIPYKIMNNGATLSTTFAKPKYMEKDVKYSPVSMDDFFSEMEE